MPCHCQCHLPQGDASLRIHSAGCRRYRCCDVYDRVLHRSGIHLGASDGAGGTILIYERTTTSTTSDSQAAAYNVNYYNKTYTPGVHSNSTTTQNTSYVHLFIDKDGVCYNVRSNHQEVVREVDEEQLAKNRKKGKIWGAIGGGLFGLILSLAAIAGGA